MSTLTQKTKANEETTSYLTFLLGDEKFALDITHVKEIIELGNVTKVPNSLDYLLGVINLRGQIIPLVDTKRKLALPATENSAKTRVIILTLPLANGKSLDIGVLVDAALEVLPIHPDDILPPPSIEERETETPITGMWHHQDDIVLLMDLQRIFKEKDFQTIASAGQ